MNVDRQRVDRDPNGGRLVTEAALKRFNFFVFHGPTHGAEVRCALGQSRWGR